MSDVSLQSNTAAVRAELGDGRAQPFIYGSTQRSGKRLPNVLLMVETSREHGRQMLCGIAEYARFHGPWTFYHEPGGRNAAYPALDGWHVDGVIARGEKCPDLGDRQVPFVCASDHKHQLEGVVVSTDNVAVGRIAAEHLLQRGFKHYAFCGYKQREWSRQRRKAFHKCVCKVGFKVSEFCISEKSIRKSWDHEMKALSQWLESLPKPIGMLACNDEQGKHVIEACKMSGIDVPAHVSVLGVDNDEIVCGLCNPPLTSVSLGYKQAGYEAARALDRMMSGLAPESQQIINQVNYIVTRQSTDILAVDDLDVAAAVRYIHEHAKRPIQVADVAEAVGVSQRCLYGKFNQILGHSVHKEILRVRTEQIARMLIETNLSISQIATSLGFPCIDHVARYFRRQKGISPKEYRERYARKHTTVSHA
jgi:LacI family transcriptional regulator